MYDITIYRLLKACEEELSINYTVVLNVSLNALEIKKLSPVMINLDVKAHQLQDIAYGSFVAELNTLSLPPTVTSLVPNDSNHCIDRPTLQTSNNAFYGKCQNTVL